MNSANSWIEEFVIAAKGNSLSEEDCEAILALAGVAAHSSERTAAPLTCWVAAAAGISPVDALDIARSLASKEIHDDPGMVE